MYLLMWLFHVAAIRSAEPLPPCGSEKFTATMDILEDDWMAGMAKIVAAL